MPADAPLRYVAHAADGNDPQRWVAVCADGRRIEIALRHEEGGWIATRNDGGIAGHLPSSEDALLAVESNLVGIRKLVTELHPASEPTRAELLAALRASADALRGFLADPCGPIAERRGLAALDENDRLLAATEGRR